MMQEHEDGAISAVSAIGASNLGLRRWKARLVGGLLLAGLVAASAVLVAQPSGDAPSSTIPYRGYLEEGGAPVEGDKDVTACLYIGRASVDCIWSETHRVRVLSGHFGMSLGAHSSLDEVLQAGGDLYVGITIDSVVNGTAQGQPTPLQGKQPLSSVPFARRASPGGDFVVDGALVVDGRIGVGTREPRASLEVSGDVIAGSVIRRLARSSGTNEVNAGQTTGPIAGRTLSFTKRYDETGVRVAYTDVLRTMGLGNAGYGCRWEIRFDGQSCPTGAIAFQTHSYAHAPGVYWVQTNQHEAQTIEGICEGTAGALPAGTYTITFDMVSSSIAQADCYVGFQASRWTLQAEEVL